MEVGNQGGQQKPICFPPRPIFIPVSCRIQSAYMRSGVQILVGLNLGPGGGYSSRGTRARGTKCPRGLNRLYGWGSFCFVFCFIFGSSLPQCLWLCVTMLCWLIFSSQSILILSLAIMISLMSQIDLLPESILVISRQYSSVSPPFPITIGLIGPGPGIQRFFSLPGPFLLFLSQMYFCKASFYFPNLPQVDVI